jgi:uncharacterized protein YqjF (DUF2071 family)
VTSVGQPDPAHDAHDAHDGAVQEGHQSAAPDLAAPGAVMRASDPDVTALHVPTRGWSSLLDVHEHRPWPLEPRPWIATMAWCDLLFLHWELPVDVLARHIPAPLRLDTFDGRAYVGIVPFRMADVGFRGLPMLPFASAFPELNVRTYVRVGDRPGVFFFSLDAASRLAVFGGRHVFWVPYHHAQMDVKGTGASVEYRSERRDRRGGEGRFEARWQTRGDAFLATPGSLEHWLTERYCLYAMRRGVVWRGEIHHAPWPLRDAEVEITTNTVTRGLGFELPDAPPIRALAASRVDVLAWRYVPA